jgi:glycosyltransferase involved in cell wall biosynthesis
MNPVTSESWPRITIVTAVRNGARYIEDTIRSITSQNYPNLEYIVVDGVSTDGTLDIIRRYEKDIAWWVSQPDKGVYEALNTGFLRSTGEIMGWLHASDKLQPGGLRVVGGVFRELPEVEWITGHPTAYSTDGAGFTVQELARWSRLRFLAGANQYVQQESTYWRRSLWERAGGALSTAYRAEGDFDQWVRFFRHAQLYTVDAFIAGYRAHPDALSSGDIDRYDRICDEIADRELFSLRGARAAKVFRRITRAVRRIPKVRGAWNRIALKALYRLPGPDWPPVIERRGDRWLLQRR